MAQHELSQAELTEVLRRASEIEAATHSGTGGLEEYVRAAEEAGISREATLYALRERFGFVTDMPSQGEMVFARSADGHHYAASVVSVEGNLAKVRFVNGSEAKVSLVDIRDFGLTPGQKLSAQSSGMWFDSEVIRYNVEARSVTVNMWGSEETLPLEKVRMRKPTMFEQSASAQMWVQRAAIFLAGTGAGMLLLKLITRS